MAGRFDLTISVFDIEEDELIKIRNAVLMKASPTTDVSISSEERADAQMPEIDVPERLKW